jgi:hypothetical protein
MASAVLAWNQGRQCSFTFVISNKNGCRHHSPFIMAPYHRIETNRRSTSWFFLWFWHNRNSSSNADAIVLASAPLISALARTMASAFWWRIIANHGVAARLRFFCWVDLRLYSLSMHILSSVGARVVKRVACLSCLIAVIVNRVTTNNLITLSAKC